MTSDNPNWVTVWTMSEKFDRTQVASEDGNRYRGYCLSDDADNGLYVVIKSWDDNKEHVGMKSLEGKRVRVTIEVLDD